MTWMEWFYGLLANHTPLTDIVPAAHIHAAGDLTGSPEYDPFIVIRWLPATPGPWQGVENVRCEVWTHDRGQSYMTIDRVGRGVIRPLVLAQMSAPNNPLVGQPTWEGISQELTDDAFGTITKNVAFRFSGKVE